VFSKFGAMIGGRLRGSVSGSASIQPHQGGFYRICFGSTLFQGYGLSETAAEVIVQSYFSSNYAGVGSCLSQFVSVYLRSIEHYQI
jgi:long-subunit acyl-CoA synthetase (AMP-forming)